MFISLLGLLLQLLQLAAFQESSLSFGSLLLQLLGILCGLRELRLGFLLHHLRLLLTLGDEFGSLLLGLGKLGLSGLQRIRTLLLCFIELLLGSFLKLMSLLRRL